MKLSNRQIGAVGVARVVGALFRNGYSVLTPMEDFTGYDLVAEKNGKFIRIQVKTSSKTESDKLHYRFMTSFGMDSKTTYSKTKVDYIICWAMDEDLFWVFTAGQCRSATKKVYPNTGSSWRILSDL
jgi:hypothetical protein